MSLKHFSEPTPRNMAHEMMAVLHNTGGDEGDVVRALLTKMLDPTEGMLSAADAAYAVVGGEGKYFEVIWTAMIEHILAEERGQ